MTVVKAILPTLKREEGTLVAPDIIFIFLRNSWLAADNPRRHKGDSATEHKDVFGYSQLLQGGGGEGGALFSAEQRCPAMATSTAAERLGTRLPTPRLTHLGAGGLVRAEIAFFSYGQRNGGCGEERLGEVRLEGTGCPHLLSAAQPSRPQYLHPGHRAHNSAS